jgi:hypothetical protein
VLRHPREISDDAATADLVTKGVAMNASAMVDFTNIPGVDLTECVAAVTALTDRVRANNLGDLEAMLGAQAVSLNAIFTFLVVQAKLNLTHYPDAMERCLRLAFKAQAQCSTTVERLAVIKNPAGAVFAKQANIAHGPQQVNNTLHVARAGESESAPNELLTPDGE